MGQPVIVAFGDSTTAFRDTVEKVYSQRLELLVNDRGVQVAVLNSGKAKSDTDDARSRFDQDVLRHNPDVTILQFGINDAAVDVFDGTDKPRVGLERFTSNLKYFESALEDVGSKCILMTPNPLRWAPHTREKFGRAPYEPDAPRGFSILVDDYAQAVREIAASTGATLVDIHRAFERPEGNVTTGSLLLDGMHPNDRGHELVAGLLCPVVAAMLKEREEMYTR